MKILVTGATGYVGGRLVTRLLEHGYSVRCMVRDPGRLQGRVWRDKVEVIQGDVLDPASLFDALKDIEVAYYLVHSMSGGQDFHSRDLEAARTFSQSAKAAGVNRIIYLGGLGDPKSNLSEHLLSRHQTGDALRESGLPVTEFQAAVIVGSGSLSFEMIRYLSERVPIMICPQWVYTRVQPISIRNVLDYMAAALTTPESLDRIIEIGGTDVLTYGEMMMQYSQVRGLKRWLISVPFLSPRFSYYWVHLVTPIPANIARPLIQGLRNEVIVRDNLAREIFPNIRLMGYTEAVQAALVKLEAREVETVWSDALVTTLGHKAPVMMTTQQGMVWEHRQMLVHAEPHKVFSSFTSLGGQTGWLYLNWMWQLRGLIDRLVGGVGMRRGRRDPQDVRVGDALDFWRVEAVENDRLMRLRAEMKLPGLAWLQFQAQPQPDGHTLLSQTAFFAPKGLFGWLYWYGLYPIHGLIFSGLIRRLAERV
jgi:uncharacterized protein YbjT (DUF2867 family)